MDFGGGLSLILEAQDSRILCGTIVKHSLLPALMDLLISFNLTISKLIDGSVTFLVVCMQVCDSTHSS